METIGAVTKWQARALRPSEIPSIVHQAFHELQIGRARPVEIEIPPDVCKATVLQYQKHDSGRGSADWPAYLRMLDRIDPSYRT